MSLRLYLNAIRATLVATLCLQEFATQTSERRNTVAPEIETQQQPELLLNSVIIHRNAREKCLIEASINSVRVSFTLRVVDEITRYICEKLVRFIQLRAELFVVLRRTSVKGYDFSLLITNRHLIEFDKHRLIDFALQMMEDIDKEVAELTFFPHSRARIAVQEFLSEFTPIEAEGNS
eukprot:TRINITY_DN15467_c0_g1_i1.p1 TRINITY_DN15467_c0_g1~~TRINITY_DN15467_c0_g1_i1.p1  ORF type:complete len:178 (+),score=22.48 TRINITY_DN15467_c0_g1_i1:101-634(+)